MESINPHISREYKFGLKHSLANWDSCPTPAKNDGIEYLQSWTPQKLDILSLGPIAEGTINQQMIFIYL